MHAALIQTSSSPFSIEILSFWCYKWFEWGVNRGTYTSLAGGGFGCKYKYKEILPSVREWDGVWTHAVRVAGQDLLNGECTMRVRRRLERLAEAYRAVLCDPVHIHSLPLQGVVSQPAPSIVSNGLWLGPVPGYIGPLA